MRRTFLTISSLTLVSPSLAASSVYWNNFGIIIEPANFHPVGRARATLPIDQQMKQVLMKKFLATAKRQSEMLDERYLVWPQAMLISENTW